MLLPLPVDALRETFLDLRARRRPVVVTSPTGSGKSTRVPLWCAETGPVLVVEPRRLAARALARRVASESRTRLGELAGYAVKDDARWSEDTRILFCTPGVALRLLASGELDRFPTWVLDEFHERRAETDLLLALARHRGESDRIVLLSATLDAPTLARDLGAEVLHSDGRLFPVDIEYQPAPQRSSPHDASLPLRIERALAGLETNEGTVLVFLPGVGEIHETRAWLEGRIAARILCLHGQMPAEEQDLALSPPEPGTWRVVLATNVAESALTVPDVVAVVDSGLERRLVREGGLSTLSLEAISQSSADQRTGRAGRLRPGRCVRLWARTARLVPRPPPSIQLDEPDDWLLALLSCGISPEGLPWLDRPLATGLRDARERLANAQLWDADPWDPDLPAQGRLTQRGAQALDLPLEPALAGFVLALRDTPAAFDALRLAAALSTGRPLLRAKPHPQQAAWRHEIAGSGGDAALLARLTSLDESSAREAGVHLPTWREACQTRERLVSQLGLDETGWPATFQLRSILSAWAALFPRALRLRRGAAGREEYALGGGGGWLLSRDSLAHGANAPELVLTFSFHSGEDRTGKTRTWIDAAAALSRQEALAVEAGRAEILHASVVEGELRCRMRRKSGDAVLGESDRIPTHPGTLGQVLARTTSPLSEVESSLERWWRARCGQAGRWLPPPGSTLDWLARAETRDVLARGLEARLAGAGPTPPATDDALLQRLFPATVPSPRGPFDACYDALKGKVVLRFRGEGKAPSSRDLPRLPAWEGWTVSLAKG